MKLIISLCVIDRFETSVARNTWVRSPIIRKWTSETLYFNTDHGTNTIRLRILACNDEFCSSTPPFYYTWGTVGLDYYYVLPSNGYTKFWFHNTLWEDNHRWYIYEIMCVNCNYIKVDFGTCCCLGCGTKKLESDLTYLPC